MVGEHNHPPGTESSLFVNPTAYLTPQESMFQISSLSVKSFNLEFGEHRDIESQKFYIDISDRIKKY